MKMPFGKYKGKELNEIPKNYLHWLRSQDWLGGWLSNAVAEELGEIVQEKPKEPWKPRAEMNEFLPTFSVRPSGNLGQEILDQNGHVIAWTTDEWIAQVICKLLTENEDSPEWLLVCGKK